VILSRISSSVGIVTIVGTLVFAGGADAQGRQDRRSRGQDAQPSAEGGAVPRGPSRRSPQARPPGPTVVPDSARQQQGGSAPIRRGAPERVMPNSRTELRGGAIPRYSAPRTAPTLRYADPTVVAPRYAPAPRYSTRTYGTPRYSAPRYVSPYRYAVRPLYRPIVPYYDFRPRFRVGLGIFIGYPVAFPSWYDPYVPGAYAGYRPGISYGGVSFDIRPYNADLYVDGEYVGTVNDFSPLEPPLTLPAGRHRIDVEAYGYAPLSFDITVVPRQVIPYQGTLSR
jgi:hypothetical protein